MMDEETRAARFAADISRREEFPVDETRIKTAADLRFDYFLTVCILIAFIVLMFVVWRVNGDAMNMAERGFCWNGAQGRYEPCQWSQK